jgi:hypothetical protein
MKDTIIPFMSKSCLVMSDFNIQNTETQLQDVMTHTDPSKCINDQTLGSDTEFCRTSLLKLSDQIVRQMSDQILPGQSESLHSQIVKL